MLLYHFMSIYLNDTWLGFVPEGQPWKLRALLRLQLQPLLRCQKKGYGHVLTCRPIHESMVVSLYRDRWFVWGWYVLHCLAMIPRVYGIYTCAVLLLFRKPCHTCQTHPHQRCGPAVQVAWMPWIPCQCHLSVLQLRLLLLRPARQSNPCLRQWHKVSARPSISRRTIQRRLRLCKSKVVLCPLKLY